MKILNLREADGYTFTTLFLGTEMSPNTAEMCKLLREHMSSFNAITSVDNDYIRYRASHMHDISRDEIIKCLNANGYFEYKPVEIALGN